MQNLTNATITQLRANFGFKLPNLIRLKTGRVCAPNKDPRCSEENLKDTPCKKRKEIERSKPKHPFQHFFDKMHCCPDPCRIAFPRFDDLYFKESDKSKRVYTRTWRECPPIRVAKRPVCCRLKDRKPPFHKRVTKPQTACPPLFCKPAGSCPFFKIKGCPEVRRPPKCDETRKPSDCKKRCTPNPSFSECTKDPIRPLRPVECRCLRVIPMCEVWEYLRSRPDLMVEYNKNEERRKNRK